MNHEDRRYDFTRTERDKKAKTITTGSELIIEINSELQDLFQHSIAFEDKRSKPGKSRLETEKLLNTL